MLRVTLKSEGYVLEDVTDPSEEVAVLNGTLESSSGAIYLQSRGEEDATTMDDLTAEDAERIMSALEEQGLLSILVDQSEALKHANDRLEDEAILRQMEEGESMGIWNADDGAFEDDVILGMTNVSAFRNRGVEAPLAGENLAAMLEGDDELSKEDKIEILQASAADLIDSIMEVRSEAFMMAETLDELLDPTDHKSRNAMSRLLEALGGEFKPSDEPMADNGDVPDASVTFPFQQMQVDRVTESVMWAAASIVEA